MARKITQRELRNDSGSIMRALDTGESFLVTRNGITVGELSPLRRRRMVTKDLVLSVFAHSEHINSAQFRKDVDLPLDQDPTLRD